MPLEVVAGVEGGITPATAVSALAVVCDTAVTMAAGVAPEAFSEAICELTPSTSVLTAVASPVEFAEVVAAPAEERIFPMERPWPSKFWFTALAAV